MTVLPESFLRCMTPADRAKLGNAGLTADECAAKAQIKNERQLQRMIVNLLRQRDIEVCWHRTDKKSAATIGWPDITFAAIVSYTDKENLGFITTSIPVVWEVKFGDGRLSLEQERMIDRLQVNGWNVRVIRSVDDALAELKRLGL